MTCSQRNELLLRKKDGLFLETPYTSGYGKMYASALYKFRAKPEPCYGGNILEKKYRKNKLLASWIDPELYEKVVKELATFGGETVREQTVNLTSRLST